MPYDPEESKYLLHPVPGWLKLACPVHPVHSGENPIKGLGHSLEQALTRTHTQTYPTSTAKVLFGMLCPSS